MGFLGIGGSSKNVKETTKEILNDTRVKNSIKKFNETINESTVKMMQTTMVNAAAGAEVNNTISIGNVKTSGAFVLSDISQANMVKMNLSVLSKSEMKSDMVTDMTNKIQTQLANDAKASSDSSSKDGEQLFSGLASAIGDTVSDLGNSIMGGSSSSKDNLSIKNIMDVENDTELENKVRTSITNEMVNDTVSNVSLKILGANTIEVGNIEAGGGVVISNINQENIVDAMMEAVAESGLGNKILSKMLNIDEADIKNAADTATTATDEKVGTLDAAGDAAGNVIEKGGEAVSSTIDSASGFLSAGLTAMIMPLLIIGVVGIALFFLAKPLLSKGMDKSSKTGKTGKMIFGAKLLKGGSSSIKKLLNNSYITQIKKQLMKYTKQSMKYATMDNLIIVLSLMVGYKFIPKIFNFIKSKMYKEQFGLKDNKKTIKFSNEEGKFLNIIDGKLTFGSDEENALNFLLEIIRPNKVLQLSLKDKNDELSFLMKDDNKQLNLVKYTTEIAGEQLLNYEMINGKIILGNKKKFFKNDFTLSRKKEESMKMIFHMKGDDAIVKSI